MAYVFGIEGVPIFEMLFVVTVLMLLGLFFVLFQLKKLTRVLKTSNMNIKRFEADLTQLEVDAGKAPAGKLMKFINEQVIAGKNNQEIKQMLLSKGWSAQQIDRVMYELS